MTWWKVQKCFKDRDYFKHFLFFLPPLASWEFWHPPEPPFSPRLLPWRVRSFSFHFGRPHQKRERCLFGNEKSFLQKKKVASGLRVFHFLDISSRNNPTKNRWIIHQVFEHLFKSTSRLHNAFATARSAFVASTEWVAWFRTVDLRKTINPKQKHTSFLGQTWNMS